MTKFIIGLIIVAIVFLTIYFTMRNKKHTAKKNKPIAEELKSIEVAPQKTETTQTVEDLSKVEKVEKTELNPTLNFDQEQEFDFSGYAKTKAETTTKPEKIQLPMNFNPDFEKYIPRRGEDMPSRKRKLSLIEEFDSLSPEMKAFILSGSLNKKSIDNSDR